MEMGLLRKRVLKCIERATGTLLDTLISRERVQKLNLKIWTLS
jgi:hypothetical protein